MLPGLRGRLITASFAREVLPALAGAESPPAATVAALDRWGEQHEASSGPAISLRAVADGLVIPLLRILGFDILRRSDEDGAVQLDASTGGLGWGMQGRHVVPVIVVPWSDELGRAWRAAVLGGVRADARWCLCSNGRALRIVDAQRTWSRQYMEFDLSALTDNRDVQAVLWSLARAETLAAATPLLDLATEMSARQSDAICLALGDGVLDSLRLLLQALSIPRRDRAAPERLFEESLTVIYRILFLLFAEARGLVPLWHPIYRDRYTIDAIVTTLLAGRPYRGLWSAVKAISHLTHAGCSAGELYVTAFNGRLFSPAHAPTFERRRIDDGVMSRVILGVGAPGGSKRIPFRELDVEQLGAVYEHVLDFRPTDEGEDLLTPTRDTRKASGTFYTPRAVTAHLVRQTLEPLVLERTAAEILELRILDPAMGSGAFLVASCRYLARAAEEAFVHEGRWHPGDTTDGDRAALRREIAQRCLFGVDINPVAVQLARLSLWLATLAADKPLTFLDHHLVVGDSLVGATPEDVRRQPSAGSGRRSRATSLPLYEDSLLGSVLEQASRTRQQLAVEPDDTASVVRDKEQRLAAVHDRKGPLGRWSRVLDLWCAGWFRGEDPAMDRGTFAELVGFLLDDRSSLPARLATPLLARAESIAACHRFLHWSLAFPEVFRSNRDKSDTSRGFDAVLGNPPWDMVRGDSGNVAVRADRRGQARQLADFVREAGIYRIDSHSHVNRYALFLERALQLVRPGGRVGLVLPAGAFTDTGTAPLRRYLFDHARVDRITGLDNRARIFPIHRSVRFVLLSCTTGAPSNEIACRFGISDLDSLDTVPGRLASNGPFVLTRRFLARVSGEDDLGIPELLTADDVRIVEAITATVPWLGNGWKVRFGRELNATDDRGVFVPCTGYPAARPVLEGKNLDPFRVAPNASRFALDPRAARAASIPHLPRLAYRDVASATNRLTLIAAIVPARAVTTHTLFCLKTPLPIETQRVLCALLNSFVANYLIRMRVNLHVTTALVSRLPVPLVAEGSPAFTRLASLARTLATSRRPVEALPEYAELQALTAHLYDLTDRDFRHVLSTFPLIAEETKTKALLRFKAFR